MTDKDIMDGFLKELRGIHGVGMLFDYPNYGSDVTRTRLFHKAVDDGYVKEFPEFYPTVSPRYYLVD